MAEQRPGRNLLSHTAVLTAARLLTALRSLILLPVFASSAGAEGYGVFTQVVVVTALLTPVLSLQLGSAAVRMFAGEKDPELIRTGFLGPLVPIIGIAALVAGATALLSQSSAQVVFGDSAFAEFIPPFALIIVSSTAFNYLRDYFRLEERIVTVAVINTSIVALETVGVVVALVVDWGLAAALWVLGVARLGGALAMYGYVGSRTGWIGFDVAVLRRMMAYALPLLPSGLLMWTVNYADRSLIAQLIDIDSVGIYAASYSVAAVVAIPTAALGFVLFPRLSSLWRAKKVDEARGLFRDALRFFWMAAAPLAVVLSYVSQPLLDVLAGAEFETSTALVGWIAAGVVFQGVFQTSVYGLYIGMRTGSVTWLTLLGAVVNVGLNLVLIPWLGLVGAAISTAAAFGPMGLMAAWLGSRAMDVQLEFGAFSRVAAGAGLIAVGLALVPSQETLVGAVAVGGVALVVYVSLLLAMRVTTTGELRRVLSDLPAADASGG